MEIKIGEHFTKEVYVTKDNVASKFEDDLPDVFSTPDMIAEMESASYHLLKNILTDDLNSVGTHVNVSHEKGLVIGDLVTITAEVIEVDRRKITFRVEATSQGEMVGQGTHSRFIIKK